jgi:eukaryotic-like serine/threonine-protein kinase
VRTFDAVWTTLGLDALAERQQTVGMSETLRRESVVALGALDAPVALDATIAAAHHGDLAMETLPRLSVRGLDRAAGSLDQNDDDLDAVPRDIAVTGLLGEGGMGRVLLGYQRSLRREVALKTVFPNASAEARSAVLSEGFITGHLEHPNIIPVHELGLDSGGMPLLVMKRVVGFEWSELLADDDHPAWKRIQSGAASFALQRPEDRLAAHVEILMEVAQALAYAHGRGVIHRDLKPENVMIGESGEVYLVDWGVATMLETNEPHALVGTPAYLAPEMIDAELAVGPWTDVYLLGATLHAVLTGRPRHEGTELRTVLVSAYQSKPFSYPPSVPEELADLCNRATARDAAQRPSSALEFHRALASYVAHTGSLALADAANERLTELEAVLEAPSHDDARAARLAAECRFGYLMALREWPENPRAKIGLRAALERVLEMEIARENGPAARAALAELREAASPEAPEDERVSRRLVEGVRGVEEGYANRMRDREELAKVHHDQDVSVAARQRSILLAMIITLIITFAGSHALRRGASSGPSATSVSITVIGTITFTISLASVFLGRRWLLKNAVNRHFASGLIITLGLILLHRALGIVAGEQVSATLRGDMFIAAIGAAVFGVHGSHSWFIASGVMVAAAIGSGFFPPYTDLIFPAAAVVFFISVGIGWRRSAR